uniref:VENT homeobox n=1 Tax=Chelonoidis abingdonii TaxID=106734 RepID=A0A8C0H8H7_CHEAB
MLTNQQSRVGQCEQVGRGRAVKGLKRIQKGGAAESGSDWESGRSECLSPEEPGGRGSRRLRTAFSVEQISTLESSFKRHKYLGSAERRKLAAKMQLSEVQIKTWFQNRRMKLKRQLQEMRPEPFYSPVPFGARPLPLHYVYPAQQQLLAHLPRQEAVPASFAFPALPASALSPASTFRAEPGFWQAPSFTLLPCTRPREPLLAITLNTASFFPSFCLAS